MDAKDLSRAAQARSQKPGLVIEQPSQSPLHRGNTPRHGFTIEPPYTVHGHRIERIRFDGKLVGHKVDGEVIATNLRLQEWLSQSLQSQSPLQQG